jgi:hypothetical protein
MKKAEGDDRFLERCPGTRSSPCLAPTPAYRSLQTDQPAAKRENDGLIPVCDTKLGIDIAQVILYRVIADRQLVTDLLVVVACTNQPEHLSFAIVNSINRSRPRYSGAAAARRRARPWG